MIGLKVGYAFLLLPGVCLPQARGEDRFAILSGLTTARPTRFFQVPCDVKPGAHGRPDKIDLNRFYLFEQALIHKVRNILFGKNVVIFLWLIQSHAQTGARSAALEVLNPDRGNFFVILKGLFDHLTRHLRHFEHHRLL